MRLRNKNEAVVGGLWYEYQDSKGNSYRVNGYENSFRSFIPKVRSHMAANNIKIPEDLEALIEDQICHRQPPGMCWQQSGDKVAKVIHKMANVVDKAASALGFQSSLEKKARGCKKCGQRRQKINQALG